MHGDNSTFMNPLPLTEILDICVTHNRQVTTLLGYGKPQVLEVF